MRPTDNSFGVRVMVNTIVDRFNQTPFVPVDCCLIRTKQAGFRSPKAFYVFQASHTWVPVEV